MFNKVILTKIKLYLCIALCAFSFLSSPMVTLTAYATEANEVDPRTDYREWYFKIEDGKLYKRLYNASTGLWETDWIYVCDYPEGV